MHPFRVPRANPKLEFFVLGAMFFIQWMGLAAWMVPLALVLRAHGLGGIQPFAFATSALAAFVSPLFFGAVADRQMSPARVLRWVSVATSLTLALANAAIQWNWPPLAVLALIQVYAFCVAPTTSLSTTIVLAELRDPKREFGPIRAMGTVGWMAGCWLVSLLGADASTLAGLSGACVWLGLAAYTFLLPDVPPPSSAQHLTLAQRLGLDALSLLKLPDHRVVFLTAALFSIPLAAFYPHTPPHLSEAGFSHPAAWMSLAQTTEVLAMLALAALLLRWRLKWILTAGLVFGVLRYVFCALNGKAWLLAGVGLHGASYTLFFITAQIYVNDRVDPAWRTRAQALLTFLMSGVGNLVGYLACDVWFRACARPAGTQWSLFWGGLAAVVAAVLVYFLVAYRGIGIGLAPARTTQPAPGGAAPP
jgi:nucleoside transporter